MVLMPTPARLRRMPARPTESGMVRVTMSAARALPSSANEHRHHEEPAQEHGAADAAEGGPHELRLVVHDPQRHALRQGATDGLQRITDGGGDLDRVGAELLADAAAHHLAGQAMGEPPARRRRLQHVRDVGQEHGGGAAGGDHRVAQVVHARRAPDGTHAPLRRPAGHEARRPRSRWPPRGRGTPRPGSRRARPSGPGRAAPGTGAGVRPASPRRPPPARPGDDSGPRTRPDRAAT